MEMIHLYCQGCSNACPLVITAEDDNIIEISGNCCHRGIVSANKQFYDRYPSTSSADTANFNGKKEINCTGCSNRCALTVTIEDGRISSVFGEGCRRGSMSAKKQLFPDT